MTIDAGTGDGRAVLARAAAHPETLTIGIDADARSMIEASRRAAGRPVKGGLPNVLFVVGVLETPPPELTGRAALVTVSFPWGSLLRGCLGDDDTVARGIASLVAPGGAIELTLAPSERDGLELIPIESAAIGAVVARTFAPLGFGVGQPVPVSLEDLRATRSTWARRLAGPTDRRALRIRITSRSPTIDP